MTFPRGWAAGRRFTLISAAAALLLLAGFFTLKPGSARGNASPASAAAGVKSSVAKMGRTGPGRLVRAATSAKPFTPTARQRADRARAMKFLASLPAAPAGHHATAADVAPLRGPQTAPPGPGQAPTTFKVFKNVSVPATCTSGGCGQSSVNEPDTANSGKYIIQTSNWSMAYTSNGGANPPTWKYQDPYSLSSQFCCDQTIFYFPGRNRFVYEALTLGTGTQVGFTIATAAAATPTTWCKYHFTGTSFGLTSGDVLDYPKIAYSNNDVYVTWNTYDPTGHTWLNTGLARLPIDSMTSCASVSYNYFTRTDNFTFGLTYGHSSLDSFYWVSNWYTSGGGSGTSERIYHWAENSNTYYYVDRTVTAYNFAGGSCASQDGVVKNWCSRLDPRWETAWISRAEYTANATSNSPFAGDTILGVAITAGPGGGDPFPYVIYEYFKLNALTFIQTSATYNDGYAFAYAGCSPSTYGYVGCAMSYGGGTGATHYYPGGFVLLQDNISPNQAWAYSYPLPGQGNATAWGDYTVSQPFEPDVGVFITSQWLVNSKGKVVPHVIIWGRGHDGNGYARWKSS